MRGSLICIDLVPLFLSSVSLSFWFWLYDLPVQIMMPANNVMPFEGFCFSIPCMGNKNTVSNRPAVLSIYIYIYIHQPSSIYGSGFVNLKGIHIRVFHSLNDFVLHLGIFGPNGGIHSTHTYNADKPR